MGENKALLITLGSMLALAFLMFYIQPLMYGIFYGFALVYNFGFSAFGDLRYEGDWGVFGHTWQQLVTTTEAERHVGETYQKAFFALGAFGWLLSSRLSIVYIFAMLAGFIVGVIQ
jgi:hypothetical protein